MLTSMPDRVSALFADPLQAMFRELDRDLPWTSDGPSTWMRSFAPLSMWEDQAAYHIDVDVPGIPETDLDIALEKGKLIIRGERNVPHNREFARQERAYGRFERVIALSEWVDPSSINARLQDGVLHLTLSKKPECQRQKISITSAGANTKRIEESA